MYVPEYVLALGQSQEIFPPNIEDPDSFSCKLGYLYGGSYSRWHCVGYNLAKSYRTRLRELAQFIRTTDPRIGITERWVQNHLLMIWQNVKMWLDIYARDFLDAGVWGKVSEMVMRAKREGEAEVRAAWRERHPENPLPPPPTPETPPRPEPLPQPSPTGPGGQSFWDRLAESIRDALRLPYEVQTIKSVLILSVFVATSLLVLSVLRSREAPRRRA